MEKKAIFFTILCILPGLMLSGFIPLNDAIRAAGYEILLSHWILIPVFLLITIYVAGIIFHIAQYTDELLPLQLYLAGIALCMLGVWLTPRLLILGIVVLILSAYWSKSTVEQYYKRT